MAGPLLPPLLLLALVQLLKADGSYASTPGTST
ncbi:putative LOC729966 precursor, partial [Daubentonia madagascariensis]